MGGGHELLFSAICPSFLTALNADDALDDLDEKDSRETLSSSSRLSCIISVGDDDNFLLSLVPPRLENWERSDLCERTEPSEEMWDLMDAVADATLPVMVYVCIYLAEALRTRWSSNK